MKKLLLLLSVVSVLSGCCWPYDYGRGGYGHGGRGEHSEGGGHRGGEGGGYRGGGGHGD